MVDDVVDGLLCAFVDGVRCPHLRYARSVVLGRCFSCKVYRKFNEDMLADDERMMNEIDEEHRTGVQK